MPSTSRRVALSASALAFLLASCGAGDPDDGAGADGTVEPSADETGDEAGDETGDETAGSPLEQLFGAMGSSQRAVEDEVAACMRDRGWEYQPNTAAMMTMSATGPGRDPEFAEQYGYGISTRPPADEMFGGVRVEASDDPNAEYIDALSEADRDRFFADLTGLPPRLDESSGEGEVIMITPDDIDQTSCFAEARRAAAEEHPELSDAFGERLGELMQGIDDDPAMQEAMTAWSACMAEADYPYEQQREIFADLSQRYGQITGEEVGGGPAGGADVSEGGGLVVARGLDGEELDLSPADEERLARLQADEIAIAQADRTCSAEHLDGVRAELELEVADKLRSEYPGLGAGE